MDMTMINISKIQPEMPKVDEGKMDAVIERLHQTPICSRCGANLNVPKSQVAKCPRCKTNMRNVGGIWLEYVSPLEVSPMHMSPDLPRPNALQSIRKFNFTK